MYAFPVSHSSETATSIAVTSLKIESVFGKRPASRARRLNCVSRVSEEKKPAFENAVATVCHIAGNFRRDVLVFEHYTFVVAALLETSAN